MLGAWGTERRPREPSVVPHSSNFVVPVVLVACAIWPIVSALLLPAAIVAQTVSLVDSIVWVFLWQQRRHPIFSGLWREPGAVALALIGNASHAAWICLCALRGEFFYGEAIWAALASLGLLIPYGVLVLVLKPYAYAITPIELLLVATVGGGVSVPFTLMAFQGIRS